MEYYYKIMGFDSNNGLKEITPYKNGGMVGSINGQYSSEQEAIEALQQADSFNIGRDSYKSMNNDITIMKFVNFEK